MRSLIAIVAFFSIASCLPVAAQVEKPDPAPRSYTYKVTGITLKGVTVTEVVQLRYMDTASIAQRLRAQTAHKGSATASVLALPTGINSLVEDPRTNSLIITGAPEAIAEIKKSIEALDVRPRILWLEFSVLRFDFDADGNWDVRTVSRPKISTIDNIPATLSTTGGTDAFTVEITPHLNPDGTIGLTGGLRAAEQLSTFQRKLAPKTRAILTGVTNSGSASIRKTVAAGHIPSERGEPYTVFYLQLISAAEDKAHAQ